MLMVGLKVLGDDCFIEIKSIGTGTIRMEMPALMQQYDNDIDVVWKNITNPSSFSPTTRSDLSTSLPPDGRRRTIRFCSQGDCIYL
jgi:hypothetical protein